MCELVANAQAYRQFVKFAKFFATRLVQAVVQSRLGQSMVQPCSAEPDASDWFNVRIDELGEIAAYMRSNVSRYPPASSCLTLDFLLNTADGDVLPLEFWCVRFDSSDVDTSVGVRTQLYHQLSTLLKSVIAAARVTPTYRYYARKQSPETFIIIYRALPETIRVEIAPRITIEMLNVCSSLTCITLLIEVCEGEPKLDLGDEQRKFRIGTIASPFGALCVDLAYRTRMEIDEPLRMAEDVSLVRTNAMSHRTRTWPGRPSGAPFGVVPVTGGFVEAISPVSDVISDFSTSPASQSELPFTATSPQRTHFHLGHSLSSSDDSFTPQQHSENQSDEPIFGMESSSSPRPSSSAPLHSSPAQVPRVRNRSFPFAALLAATSSSVVCGGHLPHLNESSNNTMQLTQGRRSVENAPEVVNAAVPSMHQSATVPADVNLMSTDTMAPNKEFVKPHSSSQLHISYEDEDTASSDESFVKVAFANSANLDGDLGEFVRECRLAPSQLSCFQVDNPALIPSLLAIFESKQEMFDNFVSTMRARTDNEEV
uniref:Autophagy-related protein 13 n=1 Tax=Ascaris lumbricoides TaxID=6252 RepID=A0A0M3HXS4_ASCLU